MGTSQGPRETRRAAHSPGTDDIPRFCSNRFERLACDLRDIKGISRQLLLRIGHLQQKVDRLSETCLGLDKRICRLEESDSRQAAWRRRLWQAAVGAGLVALGSLLR